MDETIDRRTKTETDDGTISICSECRFHPAPTVGESPGYICDCCNAGEKFSPVGAPPAPRSPGAPETDDEKSKRLDLAKRLYSRLTQKLDTLIDSDPFLQRVQRESWELQCRELRKLSPFYGMLAIRRKGEFLTRQQNWRESVAKQRRLRAENRRRREGI